MAALTIRKGDDHIIHGEVRQDGVPVDISAWKIWFTVKRRYPDADAAALTTKETGSGDIVFTSPELGKFNIFIYRADFATIPSMERTVMHYDVQVRTAEMRMQTLGDGDFVILGDIRNSTSLF